MENITRLKLFWLLTFFFVAYFPTFGMEFTETQNYIQRDCVTFAEFNIIKLEPEHIKIQIERKHWHEFDPSGVYQLIPYYVKVFPEDIGTSRFVIQKHPFNGEWQLTEIYNQIYRRTIYPLSKVIKEKNKSSGKITVESFDTLQKEKQTMKETILNLEEKVILKNENTTQLNESLILLKENLKAKETEIQNLNSKIHLQKKTFEEKMKLLKNVHFVDLKKRYFEKEEKLKEEFEQKICTKETEIHDLHAKVKELETPNENLKSEIKNLKSKNDNLKSTNDDLKFQLELLNEQIDSLNKEINCFREEKVKSKKLELTLKKENNHQTFIKESESKKKPKKKNTYTEQQNHLGNLVKILYGAILDSQNEIQTQDDNLKTLVDINNIDEDPKPKKAVEQKYDATILSNTSSTKNSVTKDKNKSEKTIQKHFITKTKFSNKENCENFDSIEQITEKQKLNVMTEVATNPMQHENTSEQNLTQEMKNIPDASLAKTMNEVDKFANEFKGVILYATQMYEKLQGELIRDFMNPFKDQEMMFKVKYFLKNKENLKMDPNFQFEFAVLYLGADAYVNDQIDKVINNKILNGTVRHVIRKFENKYANLMNNALENLQDSRQKILFNCLSYNTKLFDDEKYEYEYHILKSGLLEEGPKNILKELKKSVELLVVDAKNTKQ